MSIVTIRSVAVAAVVLLVGALWLLTSDVTSDEAGRPGESGRPYCGSAYDVVLLRGEGFMGGEPPSNQAAIDQDCVRTAGRRVAAASGLGGVAVTLLAVSTLGAVGVRRRTTTPREKRAAG